jgi:hypothetical protein
MVTYLTLHWYSFLICLNICSIFKKTQDENVKNAITFEIWLHNGLEIALLGGQRKLFCGLYPELYS